MLTVQKHRSGLRTSVTQTVHRLTQAIGHFLELLSWTIREVVVLSAGLFRVALEVHKWAHGADCRENVANAVVSDISRWPMFQLRRKLLTDCDDEIVVVTSDIALGTVMAGQAVDFLVDVVADEATLTFELNWQHIS